jgi:hypothetical protein
MLLFRDCNLFQIPYVQDTCQIEWNDLYAIPSQRAEVGCRQTNNCGENKSVNQKQKHIRIGEKGFDESENSCFGNDPNCDE